MATATGTLLAAVVIIRRGVTGRRVAVAAAAASAAALTRNSGLAIAALAATAIVAAALLERDSASTLWRRLLRGTAGAAAVVGSVAATSGWFWLRNLRLYGDVTGSSALFEHFGRKPTGTVVEVLLSPDYWTLQAQRVIDFSFYRFSPDAIGDSRTVWARRCWSPCRPGSPWSWPGGCGTGSCPACAGRAGGWSPGRSPGAWSSGSN